MNALGADITDFYDNHWPEGFYVDDMDETLPERKDGGPDLEPETKYDLKRFGFLQEEGGDKSMTFAQAFSKWIRSRDTETLVVQINKGNKVEVLKILKEAGLTS